MNERSSAILRRNRETIGRIAALHHTRNPRVFGSTSRGQDTEGSDLDLLVRPLPGTTLFELGAIQIELEEALGIRVVF